MTPYEISARGIGKAGVATPLAKPAELICFALALAHLVYLATSYLTGSWLVGADGRPLPTDFVNVWAAGRLALDGHPAAAYDWPIHKAAEVVALGYPFDGYFGWHYPPPFLFAAAALATLPYVAAYAGWVFVTFPAYLAAIRGIAGDRNGYLFACAFPAVLSNFIVGQNGFLTAGLMGGALLFIERKPVLAGCFLGLLTYKPHLGLLFPIVLAASGRWRVFSVAVLVAVLMAAASAGAFGLTAWEAFFLSISHTSQAFLADGWADWSKLQTVFGLVRTLGGSEALAWALQGAVATFVAAGVSLVWRSAASSSEIKAAALATGAMLATPYLYTYDLVVAAVPLAFLYREARRSGFLAYEPAGIALACFLIASFPFVKLPVGLAALLVTAALVSRRAHAALRKSNAVPQP
jgi:hypothetical protein